MDKILIAAHDADKVRQLIAGLLDPTRTVRYGGQP